jgi:PhoH-like ATPase
MEEKLAPWFQAIMDNFELLFGNKVGGDWRRDLEMFQKKGRIEMDAITYIRGRSIPNAIILIDECQNLTKEEVKTILTRAGEHTKIILTGDIEQIDNSGLDATSNGLTHVIEKFKDSELAGHITFTQGERSRLASTAADIL